MLSCFFISFFYTVVCLVIYFEVCRGRGGAGLSNVSKEKRIRRDKKVHQLSSKLIYEKIEKGRSSVLLLLVCDFHRDEVPLIKYFQ